MQMYTIKPLEWEERTYYHKQTRMVARDFIDDLYEVSFDLRKWWWKAKGNRKRRCESLEDGQKKCEQDWRKHLERYLVPVERSE